MYKPLHQFFPIFPLPGMIAAAYGSNVVNGSYQMATNPNTGITVGTCALEDGRKVVINGTPGYPTLAPPKLGGTPFAAYVSDNADAIYHQFAATVAAFKRGISHFRNA